MRSLLLVLMCLGCWQPLYAQENIEAKIKQALWLTEQYPPYHYKQERQLQGLGIDILKEIFERNQITIDLTQHVFIYPWARAVRELSTNANAIVLSMSHTPQRANLYKLTEPLFYESISLITLANNKISLDNPEDITNYTVGSVRDDIGEKLVKAMTPKAVTMTHVQTSEELLQLLVMKRVDVIAYSKDIIDYQIAQQGLAKSDFVVLRVLREMPSTIAFHKDGDEQLFQFLNDNIKQLREDGTIARLLEELRNQSIR